MKTLKEKLKQLKERAVTDEIKDRFATELFPYVYNGAGDASELMLAHEKAAWTKRHFIEIVEFFVEQKQIDLCYLAERSTIIKQQVMEESKDE